MDDAKDIEIVQGTKNVVVGSAYQFVGMILLLVKSANYLILDACTHCISNLF